MSSKKKQNLDYLYPLFIIFFLILSVYNYFSCAITLRFAAEKQMSLSIADLLIIQSDNNLLLFPLFITLQWWQLKNDFLINNILRKNTKQQLFLEQIVNGVIITVIFISLYIIFSFFISTFFASSFINFSREDSQYFMVVNKLLSLEFYQFFIKYALNLFMRSCLLFLCFLCTFWQSKKGYIFTIILTPFINLVGNFLLTSTKLNLLFLNSYLSFDMYHYFNFSVIIIAIIFIWLQLKMIQKKEFY